MMSPGAGEQWIGVDRTRQTIDLCPFRVGQPGVERGNRALEPGGSRPGGEREDWGMTSTAQDTEGEDNKNKDGEKEHWPRIRHLYLQFIPCLLPPHGSGHPPVPQGHYQSSAPPDFFSCRDIHQVRTQHQTRQRSSSFSHNPPSTHISPDDQICRLFLTPAGCPLGPLHCPLRHTTPSAQNFQPPKPLPSHPRERERVSTVCKHWLRGLCKKGDACEFLHEYNLRRMPECYWFAKYGYCSAGDECLYAHPKERKIECPDYNRGFCKLGLWFSSHSNSVLHFGFSLRSYVPSQACSQSSLPALSHWLLPHGTRMPPRPVCISLCSLLLS